MRHTAIMLLLFTAFSATRVLAEGPAAKENRNPLTISVSSTIVPEPAQVSVRMRVEPDVRSRSLSIEWWTDDGIGGSHAITLEGDRAATRHEYPIKGMEAGEYKVTAVLMRDDGSQVRRTTRVIVVGEGSRFQGTSDRADLEAIAPGSPSR